VYELLRGFDHRMLSGYLASEGIGDSVEEAVANAAALHVVRLDPTLEQGPPPLEADLAWLGLIPPALALLWRFAMRRGHRPAAATRG